MDAVTYTQARNNFTKTMNEVCENHSPVIITRKKSAPVVMISLDDFNAIEETLYLLKSPNNAQRLIKALKNLGEKRYTKRNLIEN
jgi:antitoxin YefM